MVDPRRFLKDIQTKLDDLTKINIIIIIILFSREIGRANLRFSGSIDKWMVDPRRFLKDIQTKLDDELTDL